MQKSYISPQDKSYLMLKAMAEMGMSLSVMGQVFAAFPRTPAIPIDVLRYTFGPLIVHVSRRGDGDGIGALTPDVIATWRPRVDIERLEILAGERPDIVSPAEIWLVMFNATLESPLQHRISELYVWAAHRAYIAAGRTFPDTFFSKGDNWVNKLPEDKAVFDGYLYHDYRELCAEITKKVVKHSKLAAPRARKSVDA